MSVMLWNAIITVEISVTSSMIASAMCTYYYTCTIKPCGYRVHVLGIEYRKELASQRVSVNYE